LEATFATALQISVALDNLVFSNWLSQSFVALLYLKGFPV